MVTLIIQQFYTDGSTKALKSSGRPRLTLKRPDRKLVAIS